jgi:hypothetical protein
LPHTSRPRGSLGGADAGSSLCSRQRQQTDQSDRSGQSRPPPRHEQPAQRRPYHPALEASRQRPAGPAR